MYRIRREKEKEEKGVDKKEKQVVEEESGDLDCEIVFVEVVIRKMFLIRIQGSMFKENKKFRKVSSRDIDRRDKDRRKTLEFEDFVRRDERRRQERSRFWGF